MGRTYPGRPRTPLYNSPSQGKLRDCRRGYPPVPPSHSSAKAFAPADLKYELAQWGKNDPNSGGNSIDPNWVTPLFFPHPSRRELQLVPASVNTISDKMSRRRGHFKRTTRSRSGGKFTRARSQRFRVTARRKGYGRTSGYYGRYGQGPNAELKFHDLDVDDASIAAGATITEDSCNVIAQGTTESTRLGRKITVKSINWRFSMILAAAPNRADPVDGETIRVILYLDKQANGATAVTTEILESADYQSFNNLANKSRFRTLMDRTYEIHHDLAQTDGTNTGSYPEKQVNDSFFKKCNIPIEYDNTATDGSIATIRSNNIGVLLLAKNGTTSFDSKMRLRFSDQG